MYEFVAVYWNPIGCQYSEQIIKASSYAEAEIVAKSNFVHGLDEFQFVNMLVN